MYYIVCICRPTLNKLIIIIIIILKQHFLSKLEPIQKLNTYMLHRRLLLEMEISRTLGDNEGTSGLNDKEL